MGARIGDRTVGIQREKEEWNMESMKFCIYAVWAFPKKTQFMCYV